MNRNWLTWLLWFSAVAFAAWTLTPNAHKPQPAEGPAKLAPAEDIDAHWSAAKDFAGNIYIHRKR